MKPIPILYFIAAPTRPKEPVKIGRSNSDAVHRRLATLQTSYPHRLEFLFVMEGGAAEEAAAHKAFADLRLVGERFKRTKEMNEVILELQAKHPKWRDLLAFPHIQYDDNGQRIDG